MNQILSNNFGSTLRKHRKKQKLTLVDISKKSNVSVPYLSDIERGKVNFSISIAYDLSKAYNIPISQLFGEDIKMKEPKSESQITNEFHYLTLYHKFTFSVLASEWGYNRDKNRIMRYDSDHDLLVSLYNFKQDIKKAFDDIHLRSDVFDQVLLYVTKYLNPFLICWHPWFFTPHGETIYCKIDKATKDKLDADIFNLREQHFVIIKMLHKFTG